MNAKIKDHISVCVCTYHRNAMLERLLSKLALQEGLEQFDLSVVVVDNDATAPARELVLKLGEELGLEIEYGVEAVRTIPAARNRAIKLASGNLIAIIDDDEFPPPNWLITMYRAIQTFDVDGALGPVRPFFTDEPPPWLKRQQFSGAPAFATGTMLDWQQTYTGNVLLKRAVFTAHGICFDENLTTGGEDQAFFRSAIAAGCRFVAVEEAPVYEVVPPERWSKWYYAKRAMVNGFNAHRIALSKGWSLSRITTPAKSCVALCLYLVSLPFSALMGDHILVSVIERGGHHLSRLFATAGIQLIKQRNF